MPIQGVQFSLPSSDLFRLSPHPEPITLNPPSPGSTLSAPPFSIPNSWFQGPLDVKIPITIASVYAVTVAATNAYNRSRGNKPWPISKTRGFFWFVVVHNVFLAVYSAWTFVGMLGALRRTVVNPSGPAGLAGTVDSLCKIHGTSGLGNAIVYNGSSWVSQSQNVLVGMDGMPESSDLGRLWNEGLAFYGWIFYLSKFYEVLDTAIILAKGKRSSTLQTYHHAGAMMCMWAGIRYMSPPIWMFVFVNSFIHALMYTYYTLTAFSVPVPQALKRGLTTMQIIQFLVGASYAAIHSFISYTAPIQVSGSLKDSASEALSAAGTAASAVITPASIAELIKKYLFRAAGEEGLAENIHGSASQSAHFKRTHHSSSHDSTYKGTQYHTTYETIPCIDTSGQTLAIWLNVFYLTPLTFLFVRFFVKSYITRTIGKAAREKETKRKNELQALEKAGNDALKGADRMLNGRGEGVLRDQGVVNVNGKENGVGGGKKENKQKANGHKHKVSNGHS